MNVNGGKAFACAEEGTVSQDSLLLVVCGASCVAGDSLTFGAKPPGKAPVLNGKPLLRTCASCVESV
jgi:hypothetical protein